MTGSPGPHSVRRGRDDVEGRQGGLMLYTLVVILVVMWLLGIGTAYTAGGFIHVLLVVALVMLLIQLFGGRRAA